MVSRDPSWAEGPGRTIWYPTTRTGWGALVSVLVIIALLGWWFFLRNPEVETSNVSAPAASAPAPAASQIMPPPAVATSADIATAMTAASAAASSAKAAKQSASEVETAAASARSALNKADELLKKTESLLKKAERAAAQAEPRSRQQSGSGGTGRPAPSAPSSTVKAPAAQAAAPAPTSQFRASATKPKPWTKVNADPCNPKAGCTLEWALGKTGWPYDVQQALIAKVRGGSPDTIAITSQSPAWEGWMTSGKYSPKFEPHMIAAWPSGKYEPASLWTHVAHGTQYHLIKVRACGNWGGWTTAAPGIAPPRPTATPPGRMPLGVIPVVACPEESE